MCAVVQLYTRQESSSEMWRVFAGELAAVPMSRLEAVCKEQDAKWLYRLSLGIDDEEVLAPLHVVAAL